MIDLFKIKNKNQYLTVLNLEISKLTIIIYLISVNVGL